jgi:excisionase family DNA binding protein
MAEEKEYMTLDEAAESLGITRATIYNYMGDLNIKTHRFGRDRRGYLSREQINLIREYKEKPWISGEKRERSQSTEDAA